MRFEKSLINKFMQRIVEYLVKPIKAVQAKLTVWNENGKLPAFRTLVLDILFDGVLVWIALFPVSAMSGSWNLANPLLIPSYGLILFLILEFRRSWKEI
jgi:hypothetical protein